MMKKILTLLLILPTLVFSQKNLRLKYDVDKFTGDTTISLKNPITRLNGKEFYMDVSKNSTGIDLLININSIKIGCVEHECKIYFLFSDGSKIETKNYNEYNCRGVVFIFLDGPYAMEDDLLNQLSNKTIKALRVDGSYHVYDIDFNKIEATQFKECVAQLNNIK
jgi:hypothetical protein